MESLLGTGSNHGSWIELRCINLLLKRCLPISNLEESKKCPFLGLRLSVTILEAIEAARSGGLLSRMAFMASDAEAN